MNDEIKEIEKTRDKLIESLVSNPPRYIEVDGVLYKFGWEMRSGYNVRCMTKISVEK